MTEKISIIIPTLNEEYQIAGCLNSVFEQDSSYIYEVIVADGGSKDRTLNIVQKYNVKVVMGGLPGIARNNGAKEAKGNYLLFLDADTVLPPQFFNKVLTHFETKRFDVATFYLTPSDGRFFSKLVLKVYNAFSSLAAPLRVGFLTAGCCILVVRSVHFAVQGFSNSAVVLEEYDYVQRIKKIGKFGVIPIEITTSIRRFKDGKGLLQTLILFVYYFHWIITGKIMSDRYKYWTR